MSATRIPEPRPKLIGSQGETGAELPPTASHLLTPADWRATGRGARGLSALRRVILGSTRHAKERTSFRTVAEAQL